MKLLVCLILQLAAFCPNALCASGQAEHKFKNCDKAWKQLKQDWQNYSAFPPEAREYLEHCSSGFGLQARERVLFQLGRSLIVTKQYSEAIAILQQCTSESVGLNGENAGCWEQLGLAAAYERNCNGAVIGFDAALAVPATDNLAAEVHKIAKAELNNLYAAPPGFNCPIKSATPITQSDIDDSHSYGTAFYISAEGLLLTNDHVVGGCKSLTLGNGMRVQIVSRDPENDLALLRSNDPPRQFVRFRSGDPAKVGEPVLAFGFPLPGTLSSAGVATTGIIGSLSGIQDDPRTLQFSAAIQPGNSGGPLFDGSGHVIGVVEAKLDSLRMANATGTIPENVGFAIQWAQIKAFLQSEDVTPAREQSKTNLSSSDIAAFARLVSVEVNCAK